MNKIHLENFDIDKFIWDDISKYHNLSEQFIEKYIGNLNWEYVLDNQQLSENFMEKNIDIIFESVLSNVRENYGNYKGVVNGIIWGKIFKCQKLSEHFIEKHIDKIKWHYVLEYQKLSEKFIEKYKNIIITKYKHKIIKNKYVPITKKICSILKLDYQIIFMVQYIKKYKDVKFIFF